MLFAIDEKKVEEMIKGSSQSYAISSAAEMNPTIENTGPCYQNVSAFGMVSGGRVAMPLEAREHLMEIRSRIVSSGESLKSADELAKEIEEMRGGGR